jgi:beta-galactosidase
MHLKKSIILILLLLAGLKPVLGQDGQEWKNYRIFQVNAERPHASFMSYRTKEEALKYSYLPSPDYQLLSGNWWFKWSYNPAQSPEGFFAKDYKMTGWKTIPVPSDWQLQGYGEAYYTNTIYPFTATFPKPLTRLAAISALLWLTRNGRANASCYILRALTRRFMFG